MADSDVAVSVGDQLPMLLKNSAYTVDANLQKHTRAPPRTRSGRFQSMLSVRRATPLLVRRLHQQERHLRLPYYAVLVVVVFLIQQENSKILIC